MYRLEEQEKAQRSNDRLRWFPRDAETVWLRFYRILWSSAYPLLGESSKAERFNSGAGLVARSKF